MVAQLDKKGSSDMKAVEAPGEIKRSESLEPLPADETQTIITPVERFVKRYLRREKERYLLSKTRRNRDNNVPTEGGD